MKPEYIKMIIAIVVGVVIAILIYMWQAKPAAAEAHIQLPAEPEIPLAVCAGLGGGASVALASPPTGMVMVGLATVCLIAGLDWQWHLEGGQHEPQER